MAQRFLTDPAGFGVGYPIIGNNSIQFSVGDPLYVNSSGYLAIAVVDGKVLGYSLENITMSSSNTSVAKVCPKYATTTNVLMVYPVTSSVGYAQTEIGAYTKLETLTTGAITLNATTGATGQFLIVGIDPKGDGTTYEAVVRASYPQETSAAL